MGTRSLIHFKKDGKTIVTVYRQFDGYPSGRGQELADFLKGKRLCNGIPCGEDTSGLANGMGCLAAQWIAEEKESIGNVYIMPPDTSDVWEDYIYTVDAIDNTLRLAVSGYQRWSGHPKDFNGDELESGD